MSELVRDLGQYLMDQLVVQGFGEDLFLNFEPDDPNDVVILTEYAGSNSTPIGVLLRRVQVKVRGVEYENALQKIWSVYNSFIKDDKEFIIHLTDRYLIPTALQVPIRLMVDDKGRHVFVFNLSFTTTKDFN